MPFDLNIICVNQKKPTLKLPSEFNIIAEIQNKNANDYPKYYNTYCACMSAFNGIWYYLVSNLEDVSSYELCDINDVFSEEERLKGLYPFWYKEGQDIDVSVFNLRDKFKDDVLNVIKYFIRQSPISTVLFHSRYQTDNEPEYIYGVFSFDNFVELLENNKLLFNTCYIIRDNDV